MAYNTVLGESVRGRSRPLEAVLEAAWVCLSVCLYVPYGNKNGGIDLAETFFGDVV